MFTIEQLMVVQYEELIANFENKTREILGLLVSHIFQYKYRSFTNSNSSSESSQLPPPISVFVTVIPMCTAFVDLPWNPKVLEFHKTQRSVRLLSLSTSWSALLCACVNVHLHMCTCVCGFYVALCV